MFASSIYQSFCALQSAVLPLLDAWEDRRDAIALDHALGDARHHCCAASSFVHDLERDSDWAPQEAYALMTDVDRLAVHEAYVSVIALGQLLQGCLDDGLPAASVTRNALAALGRLLDTLGPFVSRPDLALRRVILDGEPLADHLVRLPPLADGTGVHALAEPRAEPTDEQCFAAVFAEWISEDDIVDESLAFEERGRAG